MRVPIEAALLRIFIGADDTHEGRPLDEAIALKARAMKLAGVTVLRGIMGYGPSSQAHRIVLALSEDLPVVIEIVDSQENIDALLPVIEPMMRDGLITLEKVTVLRYGAKAAP